MELRDLLELLYAALNRFTSIQATWRYWYDEDTMNRLQEGWMAQHPPGSMAFLLLTSTEQTEQTTIRSIRRRLWWQKPGCWREENQLDAQANTVTVLCDGHWWSFSPATNTLYTTVLPQQKSQIKVHQVKVGEHATLESSIDGVPFIDPSFLLTSHQLQITGEALHAGREALEVRATYQKGSDRLHEEFFWATADEYRLLVDKEYGILLRYAAVLEAEEFAVCSVDEVVFDEPIPAAVFDFMTDMDA